MTTNSQLTNAADATTLEPQIPIRFRWLKRISAAFVLLAAGLCLVHWQWHAHADRLHRGNTARLNDLKTELCLNEPDYLSPELKSAVSILEDAVWRIEIPHEMLHYIGDSSTFLSQYQRINSRRPTGTREMVDEMIDKNAWFTELVRELRLGRSPSRKILSQLPAKRSYDNDDTRVALVNFLPTAIQYPYVQGNHHEMVERIIDLGYLTSLAAKCQPRGGKSTALMAAHSDLEHLFKECISQYGEIQALTGDDRLRYRDWKPVEPNQIRKVIELLINQESSIEAARNARIFAVEEGMKDNLQFWINHPQGFVYTMYDAYFQGGRTRVQPAAWIDVARFLFRPAIDVDTERYTAQYLKRTRQLEPFTADDDELIYDYSKKEFFGVFKRLASPYTHRDNDGTKRILARTLTDHGLAAMSLATMLYKNEHGDWPESVEALVPKCLPSVPSDPYDRNGAPLRFNPSKHQPYSVGQNRKDDGGYRDFFRRNDPDERDDITYKWTHPPRLVNKPSSEPEPQKNRGFFSTLRRALTSKNADAEKSQVSGDDRQNTEENDKHD
jgi:hypothetical protein